MPEQVRKQKTSAETKADEEYATSLADADAEKQAEVRAKAEDTLADIDALLDEIDGVLEENAEEFVKAYRQKGGE